MFRTPPGTPHLDSTEEFFITPAGFGAWAIDGSGWSFGWGREDNSESVAAIRRALDLGVDWIDGNAAKGRGYSTQGRAEDCDSSSNERPYVFTKCGLIFEEGHRSGEPKHTRWPASIRQECEQSLRRLGVERIDLYRLRWPDETDGRVGYTLNATLPTWATHRIGLAWYSPSQIEILTEVLSSATTPASAVAVSWTLKSRGVAGAIVGAGSSGQIDGWIDAATLVLSRANLGEILTAIGRTGARRGSRSPAVLAA
jgi:aryl-alcohol dehydrogenase-like predicted oxidoreductase